MIHQALLRRAAKDSHSVLQHFIETIAPYVLITFADVPALGGSGKPAGLTDPTLPSNLVHYTEEALKRFSQTNPDQSLATHLFNGLFAGMKIVQRLPDDKQLTDTELHIWVLGFVTHDYTKVYGIEVQAGRLEEIRQIIRRVGETLHFTEFLADWQLYLDDIVFIAQNTQKVVGANLNLRDYPNRQIQPDRRLEVLRLLASYADVLVHITSPADVALRDARGRDTAKNLRDTLKWLFGAEHAPRLAYHRLTEVRGLLSNLLNNALIETLKEQDYEPYLFFPNGVVYLVDATKPLATIDANSVIENLWDGIVEIIGESETFGVIPWTTGFLVSSALREMTGLEGVLTVGRRRAMKLTTNNSPARLYGFFTGRSGNDLNKQFNGDMELVEAEQKVEVAKHGVPSDGRVYKMGEFLTMAYREVKDNFKKNPDVTLVLLDVLNLAAKITLEEATRQKGGTYFGWHYVASCYIADNPGLTDGEVEDTLIKVAQRIVDWVAEKKLEAKSGNNIDEAVKFYIQRVIEVEGKQLNDAKMARDVFSRELAHYILAKSKREYLCSLCSTSYEPAGQEATEVPFINQQYSNKNPLATSKLVRGICPVCRIELILRRVQQPKLSENKKPVTLYLYPTYFFTTEMARTVKFFIGQLEDLNLLELIFAHLGKQGFVTENVLNYRNYVVDEEEIPRSFYIQKPTYSDNDLASLFFFTLNPSGKKPTDTDSWIVPTFYTLALPLMLNVKVVATTSFVPIYSTGADFYETAVLDAPHSFTRYALKRDRFRVGEISQALDQLLRLYELHLDVYGEGKDESKPGSKTNLHWGLLNSVAKDLATDLYYVFQYYDKKARNPTKKNKKGDKPSEQGVTQVDLCRYLAIYQTLGGEPDMGFIGELVQSYARFYRAKYDKLDAAYAILRPLATAIEVTVESDPRTQRDDLLLLVSGALGDNQERVWNDQADGFDPIVFVKDSPIPREERKAQSRQCIGEFADLFLTKCFEEYCNNDRSILRERANRLRSAARFYYLQNFSSKNN